MIIKCIFEQKKRTIVTIAFVILYIEILKIDDFAIY